MRWYGALTAPFDHGGALSRTPGKNEATLRGAVSLTAPGGCGNSLQEGWLSEEQGTPEGTPPSGDVDPDVDRDARTQKWARRLGDFQLVDSDALSYLSSFIIRGLNELPLRFRRRP